jgi:hypothetical protein
MLRLEAAFENLEHRSTPWKRVRLFDRDCREDGRLNNDAIAPIPDVVGDARRIADHTGLDGS